MYKPILRLITLLSLSIGFYSQANAELMLPVGEQQPSTLENQEITLGGTIANISKNSLEINAVNYQLSKNGVRIHGYDGKLIKPSDLSVGMLVTFEMLQESNLIKISEIWVIKDE